MNIRIDNYYELLALHKTLMAVKFDEQGCLPEAQGSPLTASLAFKVFDALVGHNVHEGNQAQADEWLSWQTADGSRIETKLLLQHITELDWWCSAGASQREDYVRDFMAPLILTEQALIEVIDNPHCE